MAKGVGWNDGENKRKCITEKLESEYNLKLFRVCSFHLVYHFIYKSSTYLTSLFLHLQKLKQKMKWLSDDDEVLMLS